MRYKTIAEQIVADIHNEKLVHGQRMPSLRQLSSMFGVSMTTALNTYRSLEEQGWVVARPQSGFYVSAAVNDNHIPVQPEFRSRLSSIKPVAREQGESNLGSVSGPFGISQIAPHSLPTEALARSMKRGLNALGEDVHVYPEPKGLTVLRKALSDHFNNSGLPLDPRELVITGGCIDAVRMALLVSTQAGDGVAISSPCFNGLLELLANMSRKVVEIPSTAEGIDSEQFERHIQRGEIKAALLSTSHMNPQGVSLSLRQKQRLAKIAETCQLPIIEDDIYAELGYNKVTPMPIKYWDKSGHILWCSSFSKTLSAGLRLGWSSPGRYTEAMTELCRAHHLGQNSIVQAGMADFIRKGDYRKHVALMRNKLFLNTSGYRKLLLKKLPKGSAVSQPKGGMVLWIQVPGLDSKRLLQLSVEAGIEIRIGSFFTTRNLYGEFFRLNAGWDLKDPYNSNCSIEEALLQLVELVRKSLT